MKEFGNCFELWCT